MKAQAQRMIGTLVLTIAAAAILVGTAQAEHPNDRAGALGVGGVWASQNVTGPDAFERAAAKAIADAAVLPNDRAGKLGVGGVESTSQAVRAATPAPTVTTVSGDGFQWGDAAFGAVGALGLVVLGALAALTIRHRNRLILH